MDLHKRTIFQRNPLTAVQAKGIVGVIAPVQFIQKRILSHPAAFPKHVMLLKSREYPIHGG
jgi:hypothetical protein